MKKIFRELGIYVGLVSGTITVKDYIEKKRSLREIMDSYESLQLQKDKEISLLETQKQIDLSQIKKMNTDSVLEFNQSTEFWSKAEIDKNLNGNTASYQYLLEKYNTAQTRVTELQSEIDKFIDAVKKSKLNMDD